MVPEPWAFVLLALAAFRVWKLIGNDGILDRPRDWAVERMGDQLDDFLVCPWCAGFWISLLAYVAWIALGPGEWDRDGLLMGMATVAALSAAVGLIASTWERVSD